MATFRMPTHWPTDDWDEVAPSTVGLDSGALAQLADAASTAIPRVQALLIARHGRLAFEAYYHGFHARSLLSISSITKSVISALVGVALGQGLLADLDQPVYDYFPEFVAVAADDPRKRSITMRHLLSMTSGFAPDLPEDFYLHVVRAALERPLAHTPGDQFRYDSQGVDVLSAILTRVAGEPAAAFAQRTLFRSLGIWRDDAVRFAWQNQAHGPHTWHADALWDEARGLPWKVSGQGDSTGGFGAHFTARELAKLGLLYLAGGIWDGEQLMPSAYVEASTRRQSGGGWPEHVPYGYLWWVAQREAVGQYDAFYGSGYGGKYLYVVPALDLVVVLLSTSEQGPGEGQRDLISRLILPAVRAE